MKRKMALGLAFIACLFLIGAVRPGGIQPIETRPTEGGIRPITPGGFVPTVLETISVIITMDTTMTHALPEFNTALANADVRMQVDDMVPELSYGSLRKSVPTTVYNNNNQLRGTGTNDDFVGTGTAEYVPLTYIDFAAHLPSETQIISATYNGMVALNTWYLDEGDTVAAVMLTDPTWDQWHTWQGAADKQFYAALSWDYQITAGSVVNGYPPASTDPWTLPGTGSDYWDWGDVYDWSRPSQTTTQPAASHVQFNIVNCVQHAVNGGVNNGIALFMFDKAGGNLTTPFYHWDNTTSVTNTPWIEIKYITRKYQPPYPDGKSFAFSFTTDDQILHANEIYTDIFLAHGGTYSIFVREDNVGAPDRASFADLVRWREEGFEIGTHSRWHMPELATGYGGFAAHRSNGMELVDYVRGMDWIDGVTTVTTGWDSLLADTDPVWLYNGAEAVDGDRRESDFYWAKSVAFPTHKWRPEVLKAVQYHGYQKARADKGGIYTVDGFRVRAMVASLRPDATDTMWTGFNPHDKTQPRNMTAWAMSNYTGDFVGDKPDTVTLTEAEAKHNIRRAIKQAKATGSGVISTYTHSLKSDVGYSFGVNANELDWMLDVVDEENGWYARSSDLARRGRQYATPIPTPTAYAQVDSFRFVDTDETWYLPNGMDNRFVPGLPHEPISESGFITLGGTFQCYPLPGYCVLVGTFGGGGSLKIEYWNELVGAYTAMNPFGPSAEWSNPSTPALWISEFSPLPETCHDTYPNMGWGKPMRAWFDNGIDPVFGPLNMPPPEDILCD